MQRNFPSCKITRSGGAGRQSNRNGFGSFRSKSKAGCLHRVFQSVWRHRQRESRESQPCSSDDPLTPVEHVCDGSGAPDGSAKLKFPQFFPSRRFKRVEKSIIVTGEKQT